MSTLIRNWQKSLMSTFIMSAITMNAMAYSFVHDGIYYKITNASTFEVAVTYKSYSSGGYGGSASYYSDYSGSVVIPSYTTDGLYTYKVTSIDSHAFDDSDVVSVTLPNTITSIGSNAFTCSNLLTTINIPSSVTLIGSGAFYGTGIKDPIIVNNMFVYMPPSFQGSYEIPKGTTEIIGFAFADCKELTEIFIPNEVTTIGERAFSGCSKLKYVIVPKGVFYIQSSTFSGCTALEEVLLPNTVIEIGKWAFARSGLRTMIIPPSVTYSISDYAFDGCSSLQSLTFPAGCTNCRLWAFSGTSSLSEIFDFADSQQGHSEGPVWGGASIGTVHVLAGKSSSFQNFPKSGWQPVEDLVRITSLNMNQSSYSMIEGSHHQLQTTILPANSSVQSLYWYSSNTDILTVSSKGIVTAKARGTATITAETRDGSNLSATCTITVKTLTYDINESSISSFVNDNTADYNQITYTRNFKNTGWQALYVPFSMNYEDWKDDFDVAYIEGFLSRDLDNDGTIDEMSWSGVMIKNGSILPNTPYLIRAKSTGDKTITLTDATLYASEINTIDCSSTSMRYDFIGQYESETFNSGEYPYYINNGTFSKVPRIIPFRWIMRMTSRGNSFVCAPKTIPGRVRDADGTTFIEYVETHPDQFAGYSVYTLDGKVIKTTENEPLKPGLYIKNGKKIVIR